MRRTATTSTATSRCRRSSASACGAMSRVLGAPASTFASVDDYEAVGAGVRLARRRRARGQHRRGAQRHGDRHARGRALRGIGVGPRRGGAARVTAPCAWRRGVPAGRRGAQPRRDRAAARGRLTRRAAPRRPAARWARWPRGSASATRTSCSATPTAPGPLPGTSTSEWRGRGGARLVQLRQLDLFADLPARRRREPLLAGLRGASCDGGAPRCCGCSRTARAGIAPRRGPRQFAEASSRDVREAGREAGRQAVHARAGLELKDSAPCAARARSAQRAGGRRSGRGAVDAHRSPRRRARAHTPPAS